MTFYAQLFAAPGADIRLTAAQFADLAAQEVVNVTHLEWHRVEGYDDIYADVTGTFSPPFMSLYGIGAQDWHVYFYVRADYSELWRIDGCLVAYEANHEFPLNGSSDNSLRIYNWGGDGAGVLFASPAVPLGLTSLRICLPKTSAKGRYLIRGSVLQSGGNLPMMHRTGSGILVVNSNEDPWAIGIGGDASNPIIGSDYAAPAPDCEMRFSGGSRSASIILRSATSPKNLRGLAFTYQSDDENVFLRMVGDGGWSSGQGPLAPFPDAQVLSLRYLNGVMQLLADGQVLTALDVRDCVGSLPDVEAAIKEMVPTAFGAAERPEGYGHTAYGDQIIDVYYDGVIGGPPPGTSFWTQFRRCREVSS